MNQHAIEQIANSALHASYVPHPGRNETGIGPIHVLYPEGFGTSARRMECLVHEDGRASLDVTIRYLRLDATGQAHEREVEIPDMRLRDLAREPREELFEPGAVRISAQKLDRHGYRLTISLRNIARMPGMAPREQALAESMISVHTVLAVDGGSFSSLVDPPEESQEAASEQSAHN